jgi:hypothetical protein
LGVIMRDASGIRAVTTPISGEGSYPIDLGMKISSGSYITSQAYDIRGGGELQTEIVISEVLI